MERRSFLRSLGLAGMFASVPAGIARAASTQSTKQISVRGKVQANGKGISGVAVTDGKNLVLSDRSGNYELPISEWAEFVYISVPSGYSFPQENGIAKFYTELNGNLDRSFNFNLDKLNVDDRNHCFVVWADTQMISEEDAAQLKRESAPDLRNLVQSYPENTLFHGLGCGDLVWDKFELFDDYKEAIGITGVPFFNVIGNHDMDLDARSDDHSAKTFKKQFGPTYYSFNRGEVHYVVLDDVFFIGTAKKYIGYISENQLSWLEKDLSVIKPGTTVVVSVHIPTNTGAARRTKKTEEFGGTVSNRKQLYKILAPYKVHIMSGHTHFNESWEDGNIMEHNHGTVCGAWWTGPICGDGTPSGYGVYEVNGGDLKWYYKSTGFSRDHQLRIYEKGKSKENPDEVIANVWNWDKEWKVEWWEDGIAKGKMEQKIALDPWAVELYQGPSMPAKHKFVEPTLADHLFFVKPQPNAKEVMVRATDRFGKVYEARLQLGVKALS